MGCIVIAVFHPRPGRERELDELIRGHLPYLRRLELVTDRAPIAMRSKAGTIVEVFEWRSEEAVAAAHRHPEVLKLWQRFDEVCTCGKICDLAEAQQMFPHFEPL